jgi:hypothetical protein
VFERDPATFAAALALARTKPDQTKIPLIIISSV